MTSDIPKDIGWTRLVQFRSVEGRSDPNDRPQWGEPLDPDIDVGLALLQVPREVVRVRQWSEEEVWHPDGHFTGETLTVLKLFAPIIIKSAPISVELNYPDRARELGLSIPQAPKIIVKSTHTHPGIFQVVEVPPMAQNEEMDFQVTLAIIIGHMCKDVLEEEALDHVLGYTCGNEITARKVEEEYGSTFAKSFDRFGPTGPVLINPIKVPIENGITLQTRVNGELMQNGNTSNMIFSIPKIIAHVSRGHTLWPGTVIFTGTPAGCGYYQSPKRWLKDGDEVRCFASGGIGTLTTTIKYLSEDEVKKRGDELNYKKGMQCPAPWVRLFPKKDEKEADAQN